MSTAEKWDDRAFIALMAAILDMPDPADSEPVNLHAERDNPEISWDEFAGNFN